MRQVVLTAAIAALLGSACGGDDDDDQEHGDGQGDHDAGGGGSAPDEEEVRCPDGIPEFFPSETSGLEAMGENKAIKARLITADHVPPQRYSNTWTIELMTADGEPLTDAKIEKACAFMAVHRHGTPPRKIIALAEPGRFELQALNFTMRGPWAVQLAISSPSVPDATSTATFCDEAKSGDDYLEFPLCVMNE